MRILLIATMFFVIAQGCKKDANRQFSKWYVNTDSFYTADVRVEEGKAVHIICATDFTNRFYLEFNYGYFPLEGTLPILCSINHGVCLSINYKGVSYVSPKNAYLQARSNGGKASYTLEPTWLYNEKNTNDSVLVRGSFNEP